MQAQPIPLATEAPLEVPLSQPPLVWVIAQVRFPPILTIHKEESVADFQEALRAEYPYLHKEEVTDIKVGAGENPRVSEEIIWRLADHKESATWRVSLGVNFVAIETSKYISRKNFLSRLGTILASVEECFAPAEAQRIGLRYIDHLKGEAVDKIGDLVRPGVLGILQPNKGPADTLREATVRLMTQTEFVAKEGVIIGRWGNLPSNTTYDPDVVKAVDEPSWVLDLDMFTSEALPFKSESLRVTTETFAKRIYSVFRLMVTDEFLKFYGGKP